MSAHSLMLFLAISPIPSNLATWTSYQFLIYSKVHNVQKLLYILFFNLFFVVSPSLLYIHAFLLFITNSFPWPFFYLSHCLKELSLWFVPWVTKLFSIFLLAYFVALARMSYIIYVLSNFYEKINQKNMKFMCISLKMSL